MQLLHPIYLNLSIRVKTIPLFISNRTKSLLIVTLSHKFIFLVITSCIVLRIKDIRQISTIYKNLGRSYFNWLRNLRKRVKSTG